MDQFVENLDILVDAVDRSDDLEASMLGDTTPTARALRWNWKRFGNCFAKEIEIKAAAEVV